MSTATDGRVVVSERTAHCVAEGGAGLNSEFALKIRKSDAPKFLQVRVRAKDGLLGVGMNKDSLALWPFDKIEDKLASPTQGRRCVLVSTGALNPVTLAHVAMFETAKAGLEAEFGFEVVGGFLSPSHDLYLQWKEPPWGSISVEKRLEMCVAATQEHDFLAVGQWESSVAGYWPDFDEVTRALVDAIKLRFSRDAPEVLYLCGGDHFPNIRGQDLPGVCVVARAGQGGKTNEARNIYAIASDPDDRYREMSSTRVRKALADDDGKTLRSSLHPDVLTLLSAERHVSRRQASQR
jgi:nicotinic acid mononucleotide adenylyltransferase